MENLRTVGRVTTLLELLADAPRPLRLTEIARALGMPYSSTHVMLHALVQLGFAEVSDTERRYTAGPRLARLGVRVVSHLDLLQVARPRIIALAADLDEDVYLGQYASDAFSHIDRIESTHSLRLNVRLGVPRPLHSTAVGKLFLASLDADQLDAVLSRSEMTPFTSYTVVKREGLLRQLEHIRQEGFSVSDQESIEGVTATAAPIYDAHGALIGAVSTPIPRGRYVGREKEVAAAVVATAADISAALGWTARLAQSQRG